MGNKVRDAWNPKILLILIYLFLIQWLVLKGRFEVYRFSDFRNYYLYGKLFSRVLVYLGFMISFIYPLIFLVEQNQDYQRANVHAFIGFLPALYLIILGVLSYCQSH